MQEKRGDRLLGHALLALRDALASADVRWMLIGGLAVMARGVRRMTADIDAVVQGDSVKDIDLNRIRLLVHELALLAEEPALEQGLDQILERMRTLRK